MAHHWRNQHENQMSKEEFEKLFQKDETLPGATGKFPDGKLDPMDEGELRMRLGVVDGRLIIEFGKPIASIGFTRDEAIAIGQAILDKAFKL
jgi:hypothetical protein